MRSLKHIIFIFVLGFFAMGCENSNRDLVPLKQHEIFDPFNPRPSVEPETPFYQEGDSIILGHQRKNPYEIHNMQSAYTWLKHHPIFSDFIVGDIEPYVNTLYFRVLPADSAELAILAADTTILYCDYPLDYDILQWGSYYHDPTVSDPTLTWLYAVVPINHNVPHLSSFEVLQECYLPEEPFGNLDYEQIPDYQNGFAMLEYVAYRESGNSDMFDREAVIHFEEILSHAANRTSTNDYSDNDDTNERNWLHNLIFGAQPTGIFSVENTVTNSVEGISNAHVFIHNIIKIYCGPLDNHGQYCSSKRFRTRCWYHIRFSNHHTQTRIFGGAKFLFGPVHRHLGWHSCEGYSDTLRYHDEDVAWRYAAINNAVEQYWDYCQEYRILFPYDVNVWVLQNLNNWAGSTPLFHKRGSALIYNWIMLPILLFLEVPDMALFVSQGERNTQEIYALVFHEFSHASHYEQVGNTYWRNYVLHIIANTGYGAHADGLYHGYCGIGEMWGNFAAAHFLYKYLGYTYPFIYLTSNGDFNQSLYSGLSNYTTFNPSEDWYNPGILAKIHEDSQCSISEIYNSLNADVYSLDALKYSLAQQGININVINNAYDTYHNWDY